MQKQLVLRICMTIFRLAGYGGDCVNIAENFVSSVFSTEENAEELADFLVQGLASRQMDDCREKRRLEQHSRPESMAGVVCRYSLRRDAKCLPTALQYKQGEMALGGV